MNKKIILTVFLALMIFATPLAFAYEDNSKVIPPTESLVINKTANETGELTANVTLEMTGTSETKQTPADVVFAIDSSGSMSWNDPDEYRKDGVKNFIDQLNSSKDKVGVVNWDGSIQSSLSLTNDFDAAKAKVDEGYDGGITNMNLAIEKSIEFLDADALLPADQKFIILLTDGLWNSGRNPMTNGVPDAVAKGYAIYTIGLGSEVDSVLLQSIADQTGGQYYFATDATVLESIYDQIFKDITSVATNLVVNDIVPDYMTYVDGSATITPDSVTDNADGTTTLQWLIPKLGSDDIWTVTYSIISSIYGEDIPTNVKATVDYFNPQGTLVQQEFPIPTVTFVKPDEPVVPDEPEVNKTIEEATIPMQETGAQVALLLGALASIGAGLLGSKMRK